MKNQYFGDINDYRKYGLLRCLASGLGLPIGICWMLTAPDGRSDGEFRRFLRAPHRWRGHDPVLFDRLSRFLDPHRVRSVSLARRWRLIPGASYFESLLGDAAPGRDAYFDRARSALGGCPLLFFDPDNGIEVASVRRGRRNSAKYLYWSEVEATYGEGHSLLIYQHFPRVERRRFVESLARRLRERLGASWVVPYCTAHVVFFLVAHRQHARGIAPANRLVDHRWGTQIAVMPIVTGKNG